MTGGYHNDSMATLLYGFGSNSYGELGLNDKTLRDIPTIVDFSIDNDIVDVTCGNQQTALLTADGHIYTCGINNNGQSGLGTTNAIPKLTLVSSLVEKGIHIKRIFSGNGYFHLAAVSTTGELYMVGLNTHGQLGIGTTTAMSEPSLVDELRGVSCVTDVACSYQHTIIKTTNGMLYACGQNNQGQLGIQDGLDCHIPRPIPFFQTRQVLAVSCGQDYTVVSLETGGLMAFGNNKEGQLGIGTKSDSVLTPTQVLFQPIQFREADLNQNDGHVQASHGQTLQDKLSDLKIQSSAIHTDPIFPKIACGYCHTIAVSDEGTVYAFGCNSNGQLGLVNKQNALYAELLTSLLVERIVDVTCGYQHTFVVSDEGTVYSFGRNALGQLGLNTKADNRIPQIIPFLRDQRVKKIAAGAYHSFCVVENPTSESMSIRLCGTQTLVHDIQHLVNNPARSDVTFMVEGEKIYAHSLLLSARCEPMEKMLDGRMSDGSLPEIIIPEYSYIVFLAFVEHLYTGNVEILTRMSKESDSKGRMDAVESEKAFKSAADEIDFILELLRLADQYLVSGLRKTCENLLMRRMSVENVSLLLQNAHFRNAYEFKKRCLIFILDHFTALIATKAFVALPPELLEVVLQTASKKGAAIPKHATQPNFQVVLPIYKMTGGDRNESMSTLLYGFGSNRSGELGLNDKTHRNIPTIVNFSVHKDIVDIACGNQLTALLTAEGHIYTCGINNNGQCGLGFGPTSEVPQLTLVSSLADKGIRVKRIFSGNGSNHLAAIATTGELYTVGFNAHGQLGLGYTTLLSELSVVAELIGVAEIADVSCSYSHTIVRATNGKLYGIGQNNQGQIGIPDILDCQIPKLIPSFKTRRALAVSCGLDYTVVSLEIGGLMAFGNNKEGQLACGTRQNSYNRNLKRLDRQQQQNEQLGIQTQLKTINSEPIFPKVACGNNHTIAATDEGAVYAFGGNEYGQLGFGHNRNIPYANILSSLLHERIVDVTCGSQFTLVVSAVGKMFSFGRMSFGQVGLINVDRHNPQIIPSLRAQRVQKVIAGSNHSFCIVENPTSRVSSTYLRESQNLVHDIRHIVNNPSRSDVTFVIDGQKIYAHSLLLSARCERMEKLIDEHTCEGSIPEIDIPESSYIAFLAFIEYLYTGDVELLTRFAEWDATKNQEKKCLGVDEKLDFILELLQLADQYLVPQLQKTCENLLLRLISVENVALLLQNAHFRNDFEFKIRCLTFILDHFMAVIATKAFVALSPELLEMVLQAASKQGATIPKQ